MANEIRKVDGKIILEEKKFNKIVDKVVMKNNDSSGKITLPKNKMDSGSPTCERTN